MRRQPSVKQELTKKSCGILYHLKQQLQKRKLSLQTFVGQFFGYSQQKYSRTEFQKLIKKYDENLLYDQIDNLFDELDDSKNGFVFFYRLKAAYNEISEEDNPLPKNRPSISKIVLFFKQPTKEEVIEEVRQILLASEDLFEIIDIFASNTAGYLTVENVIELLKSFEYEQVKSRAKLIEYLFEKKNKISVQTFIEKLNLDIAGKRVNIKKLDQSINEEKNQVNDSIDQKLRSKFVQEKMRQSTRMEESFSHYEMDIMNKKSTQQFISIEKIPESLQPYFNYGSVLQPQFAILASQYIETHTFFIDTETPPYSKAYQYIHFAEMIGDNYSLFKVSESVIHRDKNRKGLGQLLQSKDIIQGALGDCYLMSAISAIVERYPELVYRLFVLDKNPAHLYGVRLFINGVWKTIAVDLCFPIDRKGVLCAAQPYKNQVWVMLLQKAWAKVFGSYDSIHSGYNEEGLSAIAGAPSIHTSSRDEGFLKTLEVHLRKGAIITCATSGQVQQMSDTQQDQLGIYSNHAYTLLAVYTVPYKNGNLTLLKIRNPWGRKQWKGDWSYYSSLWSKELKQILNYQINPQDGSFFMSYENFMMYFDFVNICQVNLSYVNSHLTFEADRNEFKVIKLRIYQKGDYFFTQYQENPRKYKNTFSYQKSKSWMFLLKKDKDSRQAIGSRTTQFRDNTLEVSLQPGQYLLISKISWKFWQKHEYTVTSYGPSKVDFILDMSNKFNPIVELSEFIALKSRIGLGKTSEYDRINASKRIYMDAIEGYGFLEISNFENQVLSTEVKMNPCKGISILAPYQLPMTLEVFPNESVIVKFIVDPSGYAYQYAERYLLY